MVGTCCSGISKRLLLALRAIALKRLLLALRAIALFSDTGYRTFRLIADFTCLLIFPPSPLLYTLLLAV